MKRKYDTAEQLQFAIDAYLLWCKENEKPMTFAGLAYSLGFLSRQSLYEYSKRTDELSLPIKSALLRIEQDYEENLRAASCTGSIFALKNRGWTDKTELDINDVKAPDMSKYTTEELKTLAEINRRHKS